MHCNPCAEGSFKDTISNVDCTACPNSGGTAMTTATTNATSISDCICSAGKSFVVSNDTTVDGFALCEDCPQNSFCDGTVPNPVSCPPGTSTISSGAKDITQCLCDPGSTRDADVGKCVLCAPGRYKTLVGDGICASLCPEGATSMPGATIIDDCFFAKVGSIRRASTGPRRNGSAASGALLKGCIVPVISQRTVSTKRHMRRQGIS